MKISNKQNLLLIDIPCWLEKESQLLMKLQYMSLNILKMLYLHWKTHKEIVVLKINKRNPLKLYSRIFYQK